MSCHFIQSSMFIKVKLNIESARITDFWKWNCEKASKLRCCSINCRLWSVTCLCFPDGVNRIGHSLLMVHFIFVYSSMQSSILHAKNHGAARTKPAAHTFLIAERINSLRIKSNLINLHSWCSFNLIKALVLVIKALVG